MGISNGANEKQNNNSYFMNLYLAKKSTQPADGKHEISFHIHTCLQLYKAKSILAG